MREFGFAIVGCGAIARTHVAAIAEIPGTRVVALVSRRIDSAEQLREEARLSANCTDDLAQALSRPDVDAAIICTPSGAHLDPALAAARAGKHVVVEKPLEITAERCDRVIEACAHHDVRLGVIFPWRFSPAVRRLKAAIDEDRFGQLSLAETTCKWWRTQEYYDSGQWRGTWALDGGGALMNQAIHNVDLLLWLMGPTIRGTGMSAIRAHERIEVEDTLAAVLQFANGAIGVIQAATSIYPGYPKTMAIHGSRGSVVLEHDRIVRWDFADGEAEVRDGDGDKPGGGGAGDPASISHLGHRLQLEEFVAAVREGRPPLVDGGEGRKSVAAIEMIYESARTGRSIAFE